MGVDGQIGLEPTPAEFVAELVKVFREVRRVLRDDGTLWLNLGDSYANDTKWGGKTGGKHAKGLHGASGIGRCRTNTGLKSKDLIGIPWRVAFALQDDGWYLRSDIIWSKPNPMPESVVDRPTKSHEYIFLLSKSEKYFYDNEAVREPATSKISSLKSYHDPDSEKYKSMPDEKWRHQFNGRTWGEVGTRNRRSVWTVATKPYKGAHFAVFPEKLIEPCILAGCPEGGTVLDCFGGSGTTARVAIKNRRKAILIDLNSEYIGLQNNRTSNVQLNLI